MNSFTLRRGITTPTARTHPLLGFDGREASALNSSSILSAAYLLFGKVSRYCSAGDFSGSSLRPTLTGSVLKAIRLTRTGGRTVSPLFRSASSGDEIVEAAPGGGKITGDTLLLLLNPLPSEETFTLPKVGTGEYRWEKVLSTELEAPFSVEGFALPGDALALPSRSMTVFRKVE